MEDPFPKIKRAKHFLLQLGFELGKLDEELNSKGDDLDYQPHSFKIDIDVFLKSQPRDKNQLTFHLNWVSSDDTYVLSVEDATYGGSKPLDPTWRVESMLNPNNTVRVEFLSCIRSYIKKYVDAN